MNFTLNLTIYYCDDEKELIQKSINKFGEDKLKDIKQSLPDYIKYESIRAVIIEKYISQSIMIVKKRVFIKETYKIIQKYNKMLFAI